MSAVPVFIIGGLSILLVNHFKSNNLMNVIYDNIFIPERNINIKQALDNIQPMFITICHTSIYVFSVCQMLFSRGKQYIMLIYNENQQENTEHLIESFTQNPLHYNVKIFNNNTYKDVVNKYDLLIISDKTTKQEKRICYYNANENETISKYGGGYSLSNITFISLILTHNEIEYKIILINDDFNYYIVNNVINNIFLQFYLKFVLLHPNVVLDSHYVLTLIDNNFNVLTLDNNHSIIINKEDYSILNEKKII